MPTKTRTRDLFIRKTCKHFVVVDEKKEKKQRRKKSEREERKRRKKRSAGETFDILRVFRYGIPNKVLQSMRVHSQEAPKRLITPLVGLVGAVDLQEPLIHFLLSHGHTVEKGENFVFEPKVADWT